MAPQPHRSSIQKPIPSAWHSASGQRDTPVASRIFFCREPRGNTPQQDLSLHAGPGTSSRGPLDAGFLAWALGGRLPYRGHFIDLGPGAGSISRHLLGQRALATLSLGICRRQSRSVPTPAFVPGENDEPNLTSDAGQTKPKRTQARRDALQN